MPTVAFRGQQIEIIADPGLLDLDAAEILEEELGLDLRDVGNLPKIRMMKVLALVSARRVFPDATMAEVGSLNLMEIAHAVGGAEHTAPAVDVTPAVAPAVTAPRGIDFTGSVVLSGAAADGAGEVLSPSSAGSEQPSALPATVEAPAPESAPQS